MAEKTAITISIGGPTNSGKTTVAEIVSRALLRAGLEVELADESLEPFENLGPRWQALREKGMAIAVRTDTVIEGDRLDSPVRERAVRTFMKP